MNTPYRTHIVAWSLEQAALLRARRLTELNIENLAEEIDSVGRAERNELVDIGTLRKGAGAGSTGYWARQFPTGPAVVTLWSVSQLLEADFWPD